MSTHLQKIDFMIAGAQKSGTTSLLRYLGEHSEIAAHPQKEFAFYLDPEAYQNDFNKAFKKYFGEIEDLQNKKTLAKSAGLYVNESALKKLHQQFPSCKLILILRNPVDRTYSSFLWEKNAGAEPKEIDQVFNSTLPIDKQKNSYYLEYSQYGKHISKLISIFGKENIKFIYYEDLKQNAADVCQDVFEFMGINSNFIPKTSTIHNSTEIIKSKQLAKVIRRILSKGSIVKRGIKLFISNKKAAQMGEKLRRANYSQNKYPELNKETREHIAFLLQEDLLELEVNLKGVSGKWNLKKPETVQ